MRRIILIFLCVVVYNFEGFSQETGIGKDRIDKKDYFIVAKKKSKKLQHINESRLVCRDFEMCGEIYVVCGTTIKEVREGATAVILALGGCPGHGISIPPE